MATRLVSVSSGDHDFHLPPANHNRRAPEVQTPSPLEAAPQGSEGSFWDLLAAIAQSWGVLYNEPD